MNYKKTCNAILEEAKRENKDFRPIMRDWIMMFEKSEVPNWSRDEFLDCMIECKRRMDK